ncbi:MAG: DUF4248 domain-containing protein [Bacteroides sp.]|nr:DUF4248 domain-containing protein [Bacteroides sp.]
MEEFRCRMYGKTELALKYCPHLSGSAARRKLMQWIALQPQLVEELKRMGMMDKSRCFTPIQVRLIIEAIGEP